MTHIRLQKKHTAIIAIIMAAIAVFSSCSLILEREYRVMSPHVEKRTDEGEEGWHLAESYVGLKNVILKLIYLGEEEATIRLYRYEGDVNEDISRAINKVMREEPIGAYAVDYIPYEPPVRFPAYYELKLRINYRKTAEQISNVVRVNDYKEFADKIKEAMSDFKENLVVETLLYNNYNYNVDSIVNEVYYLHPDIAFGLPEVNVEFYPNAGFRRILDINFKYNESTDELNKKSRILQEEADKIVKAYDKNEEPVDALAGMYEKIVKTVRFDIETAELMEKAQMAGEAFVPKSWDPFTAYGAIVGGRAVSEGYALSVKLLCDIKGIECIVVSGLYKGYRHYWNIVALDGDYYHLDASMESRNGTDFEYFLMSDQKLPYEYTFNTALYPKCLSDKYDDFKKVSSSEAS